MGLSTQASENNSINTNCIRNSVSSTKISKLVEIFEPNKIKNVTSPKNLAQQQPQKNKVMGKIFDKLRIFEPKTEAVNKLEITKLNLSLLNVVRAMQNLGYTVKAVKVDSLVTDNDGIPTIDNGRVKTKRKDAIRFSKDGTILATFTLDGDAPSDHDLWQWSGCEDKKTVNADFYLDLIGFNNCHYKDSEKVHMSDEVPNLIEARTLEDRNCSEKLLRQMLFYPEGKMLIYSIFLNQSLVVNFNSSKSSAKYNIDFVKDVNAFVSTLRQNRFVSIPNWIKNKYKQNIKISYEPKKNLELICVNEKYMEEILQDIEMVQESIDTRFEPSEKKDYIFVNLDDILTEYKASYKCLADDYHGTRFVKEYNKNYGNMFELFHEMCHYLTLTGRNEKIYQKQFPNIQIDYNNTLILKHWEDFFGIPKTHVYSKNEVKLLLNDFIKYDNLSEVLAICWNNRGKEYFGNNIYTNLLSFRVTGFIRSSHKDLFYIPALNSLNLKNSTELELSTCYTDVLRRNCINQIRLFRYENPSLLPKYYFASVAKPFEIQHTRLLMNSPSCRYVLRMNCPDYLGFWIKYEDKMTSYNLLRLFMESFSSEENNQQNLTIKMLETRISWSIMYGHFIAHKCVDKDTKNLTYNKTTLRALIKAVAQKMKDFDEAIKMFYSIDWNFLGDYLHKIRNIETM